MNNTNEILKPHDKVLGDFEKYRMKITKEGFNTANMANKPVYKEVLTQLCEPFAYNRPTNVKWAYTCLKAQGGFDWRLFGNLEGIENPETGKIEIWDGLGRLCMAQLAGIDRIPVLIHSDGNAGELFVKKQKRFNRKLTAQDNFVAAAGSGGINDKKYDEQVQKHIEVLKYIKLKMGNGVSYFPDEEEYHNVPVILEGALKKALVISHDDWDKLKVARDLITAAYPNETVIGLELFTGFVFLFSACPILMTQEYYVDIKKHLTSVATVLKSKELPYKKDGGNQHNKEGLSVAIGFCLSLSNIIPATVLNVDMLNEYSNLDHRTRVV